MLILTRRRGQGVVIDGQITLTVLAVEGDRVKIGIEAPVQLGVLRSELCRAVSSENHVAAASGGTDRRLLLGRLSGAQR